ncbi:recombinase family protein [Kitasatospora sp. NPDC097643]|uniref:recombinase family protein n=1 Tax=Kitasatospora sp. NPDC097643 TaxID=3157230 RepID=UPI00331A808B
MTRLRRAGARCRHGADIFPGTDNSSAQRPRQSFTPPPLLTCIADRPGHSVRPPIGRVPVALYLVAADHATARRLTARCREYAELRNWTIVVVATDASGTPDLTHRPGWARVVASLSARGARGVVTWSRDMLTATDAGWDTFTALFADRGALLATAEPGLRPQPLRRCRRSAAELRRRRVLGAAASGWAPFRPELPDGPRAAV